MPKPHLSPNRTKATPVPQPYPSCPRYLPLSTTVPFRSDFSEAVWSLGPGLVSRFRVFSVFWFRFWFERYSEKKCWGSGTSGVMSHRVFEHISAEDFILMRLATKHFKRVPGTAKYTSYVLTDAPRRSQIVSFS